MKQQKISKIFYLTLIMLSIGGLISTEIYITSFESMSAYYKVDISDIQASISVFLLALSLSQLIYGPMTDILGRKLVLLIGLTLWCLTSLLICFSSQIEHLLLLRIFQGVGACAGMTISRAIIADNYTKEEGYKIYLTIFPFVGMSPAIAPMIGGTLQHYFGWKSNFFFVFIFSAIALLLTSTMITESFDKKNRKKVKLAYLIDNILCILKNKEFIYYAMIPCFGYAVYFAYITDSTVILKKYGVAEDVIGYCFLTLSLTYVLGNLCARHLLNSVEVNKTILIGYIFFLMGGLLFFMTTRMSFSHEIYLIVSISIATFGNGFLLPLGTSSAISASRELSGTASGVMGFLQLGSAALSSLIVLSIIGTSPINLGNFIAILSIIGFCLFYKKYKRHKK
jgi:DHA1 family bicyclomycin/chloramphenicol resistance-like MFS transporter